MEIAVSAVSADVKPAKRLFETPLDSRMTRINMILTMVPTVAYKTLVLFEKHGGIIADNLSKGGWNCGCISSTDHEGRQFWVVAAERENAGRFIVRVDEKLTAFLEVEAAIRAATKVALRNRV